MSTTIARSVAHLLLEIFIVCLLALSDELLLAASINDLISKPHDLIDLICAVVILILIVVKLE